MLVIFIGTRGQPSDITGQKAAPVRVPDSRVLFKNPQALPKIETT
jgi:hypothetical protein